MGIITEIFECKKKVNILNPKLRMYNLSYM